MSQRIDRVEPSVAKQFRGCGKYIFWTPPLLENRWSDKVARLIWLVVVLARMAANGVVSRERSEKMMLELLGVDSVSSVRYTTRLCVLMSLGVELFTFYFALFELMFPVNESSGG
jgi:hypothetical protein